MLEPVRNALAGQIRAALEALGVAGAEVSLEVPPRRQLGDLAWAGALPLAKALRKPPRAIAEDVLARVTAAIVAAAPGDPLAMLEGEAAVEGPGFLNFRLRRGPFLSAMAAAAALPGANVPRRPEFGSSEPGRLGTASAAGGPGGVPLGPPKVQSERGFTPGERGGLGGASAAGGPGGVPLGPPKVIVEHTNINPNKAAHIGHLRNAVLGDVLVRCLRFLGHEVEVQDYIDDTGVQVADVVVGFLFLDEAELAAAVAAGWPGLAAGLAPGRGALLSEIARRAAEGTLVSATLGAADFDELCWELYPRVTRRYEADEAFATHRAEVLHAVEAGFPAGTTLESAVNALAAAPEAALPAAAVARLAAAVAEANLRCHLVTMGRLGIGYDVLPHESDILARGFWTRAFDLLAAAGAIRQETEGKNAGCWVMSLADSPEFAGMEDADKILVRSNGTVTYTGKDIAYQLWKLGLLRDPDGTVHDFGYRPFAAWEQTATAEPVTYGAGPHTLFRTDPDAGRRPGDRRFGCGGTVYNVIDARQAYPQKVVREAIRVLGHADAADSSIHFAYEMVALTPKAVQRLEASQGVDFGLSEEDLRKPFVEMSGRRGIGVRADALLETLVAEAGRAIGSRQAERAALAADELATRARAIAVGALRYQMARQGRNRVLAFDFDEALAFEGDTGPYLQYSAVRAAKIFDKLAAASLAGVPEEDAGAVRDAGVPDDLWDLVLACARTREMVAKAVASLEFSLIAGHARDAAQAFHKLYHEHPVLHAPDDATRVLRRTVFRLFGTTVRTILEELLGIPVPREM